MEQSKKNGRSSSSLSIDLFGAKESPLSKLERKKIESYEIIETWAKQETENETLNTKQGVTGVHSNMMNKERKSILQILDEGRVEPCHTCPSLYYGSKDFFSMSPSDHTPGSYPIVGKDGKVSNNTSNPDIAFRGDWWQGSLYY